MVQVMLQGNMFCWKKGAWQPNFSIHRVWVFHPELLARATGFCCLFTRRSGRIVFKLIRIFLSRPNIFTKDSECSCFMRLRSGWLCPHRSFSETNASQHPNKQSGCPHCPLNTSCQQHQSRPWKSGTESRWAQNLAVDWMILGVSPWNVTFTCRCVQSSIRNQIYCHSSMLK